ncbi:hypothetical protein HK097_001954 [Rhizophlyctis rosea]|uniref:Uncharacterized protein n=1 Tax=Rhizophlyctis rosea TaxID=64517 RepID=A0AAD5S641_9FUNG|nr:hypothetical protein HK097_001954 [Rhizophlyctis rosea]
MEARMRYQFTFVPEKLRDEGHAKAIKSEADNMRTYESLIAVYPDAKEVLTAQIAAANLSLEPDEPPTEPKRPTVRKAKPSKGKPAAPSAKASIEDTFSLADFEKFERITQAEVEELYNALFIRIVSVIDKISGGDESIFHTVVDAVIDMFGRKVNKVTAVPNAWKDRLGTLPRGIIKYGDGQLTYNVNDESVSPARFVALLNHINEEILFQLTSWCE